MSIAGFGRTPVLVILHSSSAIIVGVAVLLALAGCEQEQKLATRSKPSLDREARPADAPPKLEAGSDLADLAQRDVEFFLARRAAAAEQGRTTSETAVDGASANQPLPSTSPAAATNATVDLKDPAYAADPNRPVIHWREPKRHAVDALNAEVEPPALATRESEPPSVKPFNGAAISEIGPGTNPSSTTALDPNAPGVLAPQAIDRLVVDLSRELYRQAAYDDVPLRQLLLISATSLLDPDRSLQPDALPGLTEREREVLAQFQTFFTELGKQLDGNDNPEEVILAAVQKLSQGIDQKPMLTISNASLCTRVRGFSDYTAFDKYAFLAHEQQRAIVYLEFQNFTSQVNDKGDWVTKLSQELTIYSDRDGIAVWREPWQTATDLTRNQRHDFFTVQIITLPPALSVGKYHLKIRVRDEQSEAIAEESIPFEMVADPKMATGSK